MIGIEEAYCNVCIKAVLGGFQSLMQARVVDEALRPVNMYGKVDTLGLDAIPEIRIGTELSHFDQYAVLITEEIGQISNPLAIVSENENRGPRTFFVCDPTDRSNQLRDFLQQFKETDLTVLEVLNQAGAVQSWEEKFGKPVSITGAYSALTCIRRGIPICSVLLNYISRHIVVACSAGIFSMDLSDLKEATFDNNIININYIKEKGVPVYFRHIEHASTKRFVTFLGKKGYQENFLESCLLTQKEMSQWLHYDLPGGPSRPLYLSSLHEGNPPIGFILANGEKIGEWVHWFTMARFATMEKDLREPALRIYEIHLERPWTRDGYLMSTSRAYSIFKEVERGKVLMSVDRLRELDNPSKYRSTLLVAPASNTWTVQIMRQYGYRPLVFIGD